MCMAGSWTAPCTSKARRGFCAELPSWVSLGRSVSTPIRSLICFARGLELDSDLGAREYRALCFGPDGRKMKGYEFYHVVIAHVPEKVSQAPTPHETNPGQESGA